MRRAPGWSAVARGLTSLLAGGSLTLPAAALAAGRVFEDANGDGRWQPGEHGIAGIAVQRGAEIVTTDASGHYRFAGPQADARPPPFVALVRPEGWHCAHWYRDAPGDFALRRVAPDGDSVFFVHMSDAHSFDRPGDLARYSLPGALAAAPRRLSGFVALRVFDWMTPGRTRAQIADALRADLSRHRETASLSDAQVAGQVLGRLVDEQVAAIEPAAELRAALAEIAALAPRFVLSTGDLVLESNKADPDAIDRWMRFYRLETAATGLAFYDTIGNNEIAGSENAGYRPGDPGWGKAMFRRHFGPTHYAFERAGIHFVALDTHSVEGTSWRFDRMEAEVRDWLEADLARNAGRPIVVLNHEPLRYDPRWPIPRFAASVASDEGLLLEHGVAMTLSGHVHMNGRVVERTADASAPGGERELLHVTTGALSGVRWMLPAAAVPRGYRLVQVREGALFSAWKETGQPALGFIDPPGALSLHATSPGASADRVLRPARAPSANGRARVVVVAADTAGPFARLALQLDGAALPLERWSDYFAAAWVDIAALAAGEHELQLEAARPDGGALSVRLPVEVGQASASVAAAARAGGAREDTP